MQANASSSLPNRGAGAGFSGVGISGSQYPGMPMGGMGGGAGARSGGAANPQERQQRRVYVGGISGSVSEDMLRRFFNDTLRSVPDRPYVGEGDAIVAIQHKTSFAFVEFVHKSDADI